jgi:hypothetical protein
VLIHQKKTVQWATFGLVVVQTIWILANSYGLARLTSLDLWGKQPISASLYEKVQAAVKDGVVLSDDYMDLIVLSDQATYYQPFEYGELYNAGLWDPSALVSQIEEREFPLIVIGGTTLYKDCCWPSPVINALETNYQCEEGNDVLLLTPMQ